MLNISVMVKRCCRTFKVYNGGTSFLFKCGREKGEEARNGWLKKLQLASISWKAPTTGTESGVDAYLLGDDDETDGGRSLYEC